MAERIPPQQAIRPQVIAKLKELAACFTDEEGTPIFAFSGHGGEVATPGTDEKKQYLALWETDAKDLEKTGLDLLTVEEIMKESKARQKVLFLDACRNSSGMASDRLNPFADHRPRKGLHHRANVSLAPAGHHCFKRPCASSVCTDERGRYTVFVKSIRRCKERTRW